MSSKSVVCVLRCVLWCAVSSCVGVGAGVCNVRLLRVCVCVVCGAAWHAGKNRARPKRLRVYCRNARTCSTCGRFAGAHGDVLNVHTEGSSPSLLCSLFKLTLSLSFTSFLLSIFLFLLLLVLALALPLESTKQPLSGIFLPYSKIAPQGIKPVPGQFLPYS